jgi:hypothetical protein
MMITTRLAHALAAVVVCIPLAASAGELTKEQCLDAHSQGQDAKQQNKLTLARKLFMTCAQASCPSLVQGDCARFANDLQQLQPSVSFAARDGNGADLPDTTVYVDDALVVTRLDGSLHDLDPGKHVVKFQNGSKEQVLTIVLGSGEKGRALVATFGAPAAVVPTPAAAATSVVAREPRTVITRPALAKPLAYTGVVLAAGGGALAIVGVLRVPGNCSLSTHQCAAPPGDPTLKNAASAIKLVDIGIATGVVGIAAIASGITWYVRGKHVDKERIAVTPWLGAAGGGIALSGDL